MAKKAENLEFTFDKNRELWVIKLIVADKIVVTFRTSDDHTKGWCVKSDDDLGLWKHCTREYFQELIDLTNYGLNVLEAKTNNS